LNDELNPGKIANLVKGESSHWINACKLTKEKFAWQSEYLAIGVGDDKIDVVRNYIAQQPDHYQKISYEQEYHKFIEHYGFEIIK
jgi:putative transposase